MQVQLANQQLNTSLLYAPLCTTSVSCSSQMLGVYSKYTDITWFEQFDCSDELSSGSYAPVYWLC